MRRSAVRIRSLAPEKECRSGDESCLTCFCFRSFSFSALEGDELMSKANGSEALVAEQLSKDRAVIELGL